MRKAKKRRYTLKARGEKLAETRARIVEATMQLHQEVGPRHTNISAIAKRAGVERLTVYRHFPDEAAVFAACSQHYTTLNPPPDPAAWADVTDPRERARRALTQLYAYFGRTAEMLNKIYRDADDYPALREIMDGFDAYLGQLGEDLARAWRRDRATANRSHVLRHATKFVTWQSFARDGVINDDTVKLVLAWIDAV